MNEIENYVPDEGTENVDTTATEENVGIEQIGSEESNQDTSTESNTEGVAEKVYTEAELNEKVKERLNEIMPRRVARSEAKIRKEYEDKYGEFERVMLAGTGEKNITEMTSKYKEYFEGKGIKIPSAAEPQYSERDIEVLAQAEANDIIKSGFEEVVAETDRLANLGLANMTARDKALFSHLSNYRQQTAHKTAYEELGVKADVYDSKEFREFASQFNSNVPASKVYQMYNAMQPKKEVRTIGSMASNVPNETGVKEFYTRDEALKFTKKDFDDNPELYKAVTNSMLKWK